MDDEVIADARRFGIDEDAVADLYDALKELPDGDVFDGIFPVNLPVVDAFLAGASQWRTQLFFTEAGPRTRYTGLDYTAVKVSIDNLGIVITPDVWKGVMIMEIAAIAALNA